MIGRVLCGIGGQVGPGGKLGHDEVVLEDQSQFFVGVVARAPRVDPLTIDADVLRVNVNSTGAAAPPEIGRRRQRPGVHRARLPVPVDPDLHRRGVAVQLESVQGP